MAAGASLLGVLGASRLTKASSARTTGLEAIQHIIVMMQENHSFDSYFAHLRQAGNPDVEEQPGDASNANPLGGAPIGAFHHTGLCEVADLDHSWNETHLAINGGAMDGFTAINQDPLDPSGSRAMGYHTADELPFYYELYKTFTTSDRWFASVPGPTFPNRFYLLAGTSFGHIRNTIPPLGQNFRAYQPPNGTIFERLDAAGITWKVYYAQIPFAAIFGYARSRLFRLQPIEQFFTDARTGRLPQVCFIDPKFVAGPAAQNDEHPPRNVQLGQRFVADAVNALFDSPAWRESALILTYDEHGGYYDHVPPPSAPKPDDIAPMLNPGDFAAEFDRYGVRVPAVVVSPWARAHYVSHQVYDHTSILKFIETRFGLEPLTNRDRLANDLLDCFNFETMSFSRPPRLTEARIDPAGYFECLNLGRDAPADAGFEDLTKLLGTPASR